MSAKTYFKRKKEAINFLSDILWGFTSKYTNDICEEFLNRNGYTTQQCEDALWEMLDRMGK